MDTRKRTAFNKDNDACLEDTQRKACEGLLSMTECLESIKSMEGNKAPGMDGLPPVEFYKVFWKDLRELLVNSLNYSYASGKLSVTQRRGVFQLIPKKRYGTLLLYVKNWRPISLLNCDYKIAAKVIANRIIQVLPNLISNNQTGFINR